MITFISTNFEHRRINIKWISFDQLPTTRDVGEANSMVRLKKNQNEAAAFNPLASTGYGIVQFEPLDFLRRLGLVGDIVAELIWPGNSLDNLRPSTDECNVRSPSFRLFDDRNVDDRQILVKTCMQYRLRIDRAETEWLNLLSIIGLPERMKISCFIVVAKYEIDLEIYEPCLASAERNINLWFQMRK